ncbi:MAG: hypothetical protein FWH22_07830 [Fibromonadales bacterium]|nr:hypothetical protein [Fibromonadales bacterium]
MTIDIFNKSDTILVGDSVSFKAEINPRHAAKKCYWIIDSFSREILNLDFNSNRFNLFKKPGIFNANFYAVDFLGDTLSAGFTISVANKPICEDFDLDADLKIIYGAPQFKWNCIDSDKLTYNFLLRNENNPISNVTLQADSLLLGIPLPEDYWEIRIIATNSFGFKDTLNYVWSVNDEE